MGGWQLKMKKSLRPTWNRLEAPFCGLVFLRRLDCGSSLGQEIDDKEHHGYDKHDVYKRSTEVQHKSYQP